MKTQDAGFTGYLRYISLCMFIMLAAYFVAAIAAAINLPGIVVGTIFILAISIQYYFFLKIQTKFLRKSLLETATHALSVELERLESEVHDLKDLIGLDDESIEKLKHARSEEIILGTSSNMTLRQLWRAS
jgi:hypothetical protein